MKKVLLLALIAIAFTACKKDDEVQEKIDINLVDTGAIAGYDSVTSPEGGELTLTSSGGTAQEVEVTAVTGWETGELLEGNWRELSFTSDFGTFFLRFNLPAGTEWQSGVRGEHELYSSSFTLEDSQEMDSTVVELYCPTCPILGGNASGMVSMVPSALTNMGVYDGVVFIEATVNTAGGTTAIEGVVWAEELN